VVNSYILKPQSLTWGPINEPHLRWRRSADALSWRRLTQSATTDIELQKQPGGLFSARVVACIWKNYICVVNKKKMWKFWYFWNVEMSEFVWNMPIYSGQKTNVTLFAWNYNMSCSHVLGLEGFLCLRRVTLSCGFGSIFVVVVSSLASERYAGGHFKCLYLYQRTLQAWSTDACTHM